jgi:hypothetical protein
VCAAVADGVRQPGHHVERAADGRGELANVLFLDDAGHEDAVGPRFDVPRRPLDRLGEDVPVVPAK